MGYGGADSKFYINNQLADDMLFVNNGAERVRINQYGQLLINATSSAYSANLFGYNLGVRGTNNQTFISIARANQTLDTQGIIFGLDTTNAYLFVHDNIPLTFSTNTTERMRITAAGNVGIGNTSPTVYSGYTTLHIGNASSVGLIKLGTGTSANGPEIFTNSSNDINFNSSNTDTRITILGSNGRVGIGTTSPSAKLSLGTGVGAKFLVYDNSSNVFAGLGQDVAAGNSTDLFAHGLSGLGFLTFGQLGTNGVSYTEWMRINTSGNVGIGTTSPAHKLHVVGAIRTQGAEVLVNTGQGGIGWVTIEPTSAIEGQIALNVVNSSGTSFASIRGNGNITTSGTIVINSRTVYTTAAIYDNASAGNNVGIGFGPNSILPISGDGSTSNGTKDLGSSSVRWSTVYTSDLDMSNGIGDYTIVEGEEDLFLYNNKTNKVFKFVIQEVDPSTAPPKKVK
jgi:hypothetical protein